MQYYDAEKNIKNIEHIVVSSYNPNISSVFVIVIPNDIFC